MKRKLIALLAALSMAMALPATASAAYVKTCQSSYPSPNLHGYIYRDYGSNARLTAMKATVALLQDPSICLSPKPSVASASLVLPVNLQGGSGTSGLDFVQLGFGHLGPATALQWVYTPDSRSGGVLVARTGIPVPVVGHAYVFYVNRYTDNSCACIKWFYEINDVTLGQLYTWYGDRGVSGYATEGWSGFELINYNDQFGGQAVAPIKILEIGDNIVAGQYTYWVGGTQASWILTPRSYMHAVASYDAVSLHSYIVGYTDDH